MCGGVEYRMQPGRQAPTHPPDTQPGSCPCHPSVGPGTGAAGSPGGRGGGGGEGVQVVCKITLGGPGAVRWRGAGAGCKVQLVRLGGRPLAVMWTRDGRGVYVCVYPRWWACALLPPTWPPSPGQSSAVPSCSSAACTPTQRGAR